MEANSELDGGPNHVAVTEFGSLLLSTVLLAYSGNDRPYETMLLTPSFIDIYCRRYRNRQEALAGHIEIALAYMNGTLDIY